MTLEVAIVKPINDQIAKSHRQPMPRTHFGDPCIHCGLPQAAVPVGACTGDPRKAKPIAYAGLGVRLDGIEHFRIRFSDGRIEEMHRHVSEHAPYYHFGYSKELIQPPRYDERLAR